MSSRSTRGNQVLDDLDFVRHLGATDDRDERALGIPDRRTEVAQLLLHEQAGARLGHQAHERFDRCVRAMCGAERVVHVDVAQRREPSARTPCRSSLPPRGSAGSRAARLRLPAGCATADSARRVRRSRPQIATARPSSSLVRAATGRRLMSGFGFPLGRPRCDARMTHAAPASSAYAIVGSDSRMRVSSPMTPPLSGTLKSTRMKTRRPFTLRSRIVRLATI